MMNTSRHKVFQQTYVLTGYWILMGGAHPTELIFYLFKILTLASMFVFFEIIYDNKSLF